MSKFDVSIYSKNKLSLKNFRNYLEKKLTNLKLKTVLNYKKVQKKKKKITVLKSPHINKSAQEHFEHKTYFYKITSQSLKTKKYILLLKKLKNNLFPDIKTKITVSTEEKTSKLKVKNFQLNNYELDLYKIRKLQRFSSRKINSTRNDVQPKHYFNSIKKVTNYIKILDYLGELTWNEEKPTKLGKTKLVFVLIAQLVEQRTENP